MKLLVDENLSYKLVAHLNDLFPGSVHLTQVGLCSGTNDRAIWQYAKEHGFVIVTADNDFLVLSKTLGQPPKIITLGELRLSDRGRRSANQRKRDSHLRIRA